MITEDPDTKIIDKSLIPTFGSHLLKYIATYLRMYVSIK